MATSVWADELADLRARNAQLEATVEELTLQLADSLRERQRLEAALAATAAASPAVQPAAADGPALRNERVTGAAERAAAAERAMADVAASDGCDVAQALRGYDGSGKGNQALGAWLKEPDRLTSCTTPQLEQLRKAVKWDWLGYQKAVLALIDGELEGRR